MLISIIYKISLNASCFVCFSAEFFFRLAFAWLEWESSDSMTFLYSRAMATFVPHAQPNHGCFCSACTAEPWLFLFRMHRRTMAAFVPHAQPNHGCFCSACTADLSTVTGEKSLWVCAFAWVTKIFQLSKRIHWRVTQATGNGVYETRRLFPPLKFLSVYFVPGHVRISSSTISHFQVEKWRTCVFWGCIRRRTCVVYSKFDRVWNWEIYTRAHTHTRAHRHWADHMCIELHCWLLPFFL